MSWIIEGPGPTEIGKEYIASYSNPGGWSIDYPETTRGEDEEEHLMFINLYMKRDTVNSHTVDWHLDQFKQGDDETEAWVLQIHTDPSEKPSEINGRRKPVTLSTSGGGGADGKKTTPNVFETAKGRHVVLSGPRVRPISPKVAPSILDRIRRFLSGK